MAGADSAKLLSKVEYYNRAFTIKYLVKKQSFMEGNVTGNKSGFSTTTMKLKNKANRALAMGHIIPKFSAQFLTGEVITSLLDRQRRLAF